MTELLSSVFALAFVAQLLRTAVPYALAALGGVVSERAGVIALALEAMLLVGAFCATVVALATGSLFLAVLAGAAGGAAVAALYALCTVYFGADQIVCGVALNLLAYGGTRYVLKALYNSTSSSPTTIGMPVHLYANPVFYAIVLVAIGIVALMAVSVFGLRVRAVGEYPEAVAAAGIRVRPLRALAVIASGMLAGLGGAWFALANHGFVAEMSGGRGYIALAIVIMSGWRPKRALGYAVLFAAAESLMVQFKTSALGVPRELIGMFPFVLTIVVLCGLVGRVRAPAALGK